MAKAVKHVTPDFRSGYDLWVLGSSPMSGSALSADSALGSPSLFLGPYSTRAISVSQNKINKSLSKKYKNKRGNKLRADGGSMFPSPHNLRGHLPYRRQWALSWPGLGKGEETIRLR